MDNKERKAYNDIVLFTNKNYKNISDKTEAYLFLKELSKQLQQMKINSAIACVYKLIENNDITINALDIITNKMYEFNVNYIPYQSEIVELIIETYCDKKNIEFVIPEDTNEEDDKHKNDTSTNSYLNEIGKIKLLTKEEEKSLCEKVVAGDEQARKELIESNLKLVVSIAKRYCFCNIPLLDLIQEGNIGLLKAVKKFNPALGNKFSTYATWRIRQQITRAIADKQAMIRKPVHLNTLHNKLKKVSEELETELHRKPTYDELSKETCVSADKIELILNSFVDTVSLNTPIGEDEDSELEDFVVDNTTISVQKEVEENHLKQLILKYLDSANLTSRDKDILKRRFGIYNNRCYTLDEIGKMYGVTRERIRQIEIMAIKRLEQDSNFQKLARELYNGNIEITEEKETLYERFSNYTKEQIDIELSLLDDGNLECLKKLYGQNLDQRRMDLLGNENLEILNKIKTKLKTKYLDIPKEHKEPIKKQRTRINVSKKKETLYERFSDYDKKEVDKFVSNLCEKQVLFLKKLYGENLDERRKVNLSVLESNKLFSIKEKLVNKPNNEKETLYEKFNEYTKEEVNYAVSKLNTKYILSLKELYGENLDQRRLKSKEGIDYRVLQAIKNKLISEGANSMKNNKTIYEELNEYTKEEIDTAIAKLSISDRDLLKKIYGENLDQKKESNIKDKNDYSRYTRALKKIKLSINGVEINIKKSRKYLFSYYEEYSTEEVLNGIEKLSVNNKEILKKIYGDNYSDKYNKSITDSQKAYLGLILKNLTKILSENSKINVVEDNNNEKYIIPFNSLYKCFPNCSADAICKALNNLDENTIKFIKNIFGEDLISYDNKSLVKEEQMVFQDAIRKMNDEIINVLKSININPTYCETNSLEKILIYDLLKDANIYNEVAQALSKDDLFILELKIKYNKSNEDLAAFLNIPKENIDRLMFTIIGILQLSAEEFYNKIKIKYTDDSDSSYVRKLSM